MSASESRLLSSKASAAAARTIITELQKIKAILEPARPKQWYDKVYSKIVTITKYVGVPGLIIAAIGPTQKLISDVIEHQNKTLIQRVYLDYASTLMSEGAIDRANKLLATLENQKDFDARLQYYKAKVLIAMAIQQARNFSEAFDTAQILSQIAAEGSFSFARRCVHYSIFESLIAAVGI
jgi:hypothetical protein